MDTRISAPAAPRRWDISAALRPYSGALALIAALFLTDRSSKIAARHFLAGTDGVPLLPFFHLSYVENTGTAFGLFTGANAFFIAFTLAVLCYLAWNWRQLAEQLGGQATLALIAAGALGNLYDRVFIGRVIDFLDFRIWPVFNIADSCICVGAACMALQMLRHGKDGTKEKAK